MIFTDRVLVRLADPASRAGLFDAPGLESIVDAAFDTAAMPVSPPFTPLFDEVTLGLATPPRARVEGAWSGRGGLDRTEIALHVDGLGDAARADVLWRGGVVVRTRTAMERIEAVAADLRPDDLPGSMQVTFSPAAAGPETPRTLPLAAVILIRGDGFAVGELLAASKVARAQAEDLGLERPVEPDVHRRRSVVAVWMVPAATFDDADWPGGNTGSAAQRRAARRTAAATWLAREGIALVTVD